MSYAFEKPDDPDYKARTVASLTAPMTAWDKQEGGNHYKLMAIQPTEFIHKNNIGFIAGNVIKYICRHKLKGTPRQDLLKARHYIDLLLEEYPET